MRWRCIQCKAIFKRSDHLLGHQNRMGCRGRKVFRLGHADIRTANLTTNARQSKGVRQIKKTEDNRKQQFAVQPETFGQIKGSKVAISYTCAQCPKSFNQREQLSLHVARCHSTMRWRCIQCKAIFKRSDYLLAHQNRTGCRGRKVFRLGHTDIRTANLATKARQSKGVRQIKKTEDIRKQQFMVQSGAFGQIIGSKVTDSFTCDQCPKSFDQRERLLKHVGRCHSTMRWRCVQCKAIFKRSDYLLGHQTRTGCRGREVIHLRHSDVQERHHSDRRPASSSGNKTQKSAATCALGHPAESLHRNMQETGHPRNRKKQFICRSCGYKTNKMSNLKRHCKLSFRSPNEEPRCKQELQEKQTLRDRRRKFVCENCKYKTNRLSHFKRHCNICKRSYRSETEEPRCQQELQVQEKRPSRDRRWKFVCENCGYKTNRLSHFKRHCNICKRSYRSETLEPRCKQQLEETVTAQSRKGRFVCKYCGYNTNILSHLNRHCQSLHSNVGEDPKGKYECQECRKQFGSQEYLNIHENAEHKGLPHVCQFCCQSFTTRHHMNKHKRKVHNNRYVCRVCGKTFMEKRKFHDHCNICNHQGIKTN